MVFWMCFFDVIVIVVAGARDIRAEWLNVGRSFGLSSVQQFGRVMLPALSPFLVAALRVGSARAINGMITAELFLGAVNLGQMLKRSSQQYDTAAVLAIVLVICIVGALSQSLIARAERRFLHWHGAR
jgi:ABC-type nitrate/sulfonate/bicarbonate transport system permease component